MLCKLIADKKTTVYFYTVISYYLRELFSVVAAVSAIAVAFASVVLFAVFAFVIVVVVVTVIKL